MARRGFLAQLAHQARVAAREQERAERAAEREYQAALRRAEQARRAEERLEAQLDRAAQAERKRLEKEAREAHIESMEASVDQQNLKLAAMYADIEGLLGSTLGRDDYVDLESLRVVVRHPPFTGGDLERPTPSPPDISDPAEPVFDPPAPPTGLWRLFGKKRHATALQRARENFEHAHDSWRKEIEALQAERRDRSERHARLEEERLRRLEEARERYAAECSAREAEARRRNERLDEFIANLAYGSTEAVEEYVSIVLANSVYPEHFPVDHEFDFVASSAELRLRVAIPGPDAIPEIKAYKYTRSTDEITSVALSQKACRDRYAGAVHQVALRTLHEVFEADRRGLISTIALEVGTEAVDPATGTSRYVPFVFVGAERVAFLQLNLAAVVPAMALTRLGASVSKNPRGLEAAEESGVRRA